MTKMSAKYLYTEKFMFLITHNYIICCIVVFYLIFKN